MRRRPSRTSLLLTAAILTLPPASALGEKAAPPQAAAPLMQRAEPEIGRGIVFIKTQPERLVQRGKDMDKHRLAYVMLDRCAAARPGHGMYLLRPSLRSRNVVPLIENRGWVADPEVSFDGKRILFSMCATGDSFFHIYEMDSDGHGAPRQLTFGRVDDVMPAYLPDGRIVFSSSRCGYRDEYHAHMVENLHVMNADGSGIHQISFYNNDEWEPSVTSDGRILFSRWQVFNMTTKVEQQIHSMLPDGTGDNVVFGPEVNQGRSHYKKMYYSQPRQMPDRRIVCMSRAGINLVSSATDVKVLEGGLRKTAEGKTETIPCGSPYPLDNGLLLVSFQADDAGRTGLGILDPETGEFESVLEDPAFACFDPIPLNARTVPPVKPDLVHKEAESGKFLCLTAHNTRVPWHEEHTPYYVQCTEIIPATLLEKHGKSHVGGIGRVVGRAPLADDGSFSVEVPADTSIAFQITDPDGTVVAAMHSWVYVRPGESRTCMGCHEGNKTSTPADVEPPLAFGHSQRLYVDRPLKRYRNRSGVRGGEPLANAADENRLLRCEVFNRTVMDVPTFLNGLRSSDPRVRQSAVEALGDLRVRGHEGRLHDALKDSEPRVRREAAMALAVCGNGSSVAPLITALTDVDWGVRQAARGSLVWLTGQTLPFAAGAAEDIRKSQAAAWAAWWKHEGGTWPHVLMRRVVKAREAMADEGGAGQGKEQVADAVRAVRSLGLLECAKAAPELRGWLRLPRTPGEAPNPSWRYPTTVAAQALGRLKDEASVPALLDLLPPDNETRKENAVEREKLLDVCQALRELAVCQALGEIGDRRAIGPLTKMASSPPIFKRNMNDTPEASLGAMAALARLPAGECRRYLKDNDAIGKVGRGNDRLLAIEDEVAEQYIGMLAHREGLAEDMLRDALDRLETGRSRKRNPSCVNDWWFEPARAVMILAHDPGLAPVLLEALKRGKDGHQALYLCRALGKLGNSDVVPELIVMLREMPPEEAAGMSLKAHLEHNSGSPGDEYSARPPRIKAAYCYALGQLGDERAVPALGDVLNDPRHVLDTRYAAAVALGMINDPSAGPALRQAAENEITHMVRRACREALAAISGENPHSAVYADFPRHVTSTLSANGTGTAASETRRCVDP